MLESNTNYVKINTINNTLT